MSKPDVISTSPTSPKPQQVQIKKFDFPEAIKQLNIGKSITRVGWSDPEYFLAVIDGHLKIHKPDSKFYDLIVTDGDMLAEDWMLV
jgi:hypothetical protein